MNRALLVNQRQSAAFAEREDRVRALHVAPSSARSSSAGAAGVCDSARVDVDDWHSLNYWCASLGVSESQLLRAARAVGPSVPRIETFFADKRARRRRNVVVAG